MSVKIAGLMTMKIDSLETYCIHYHAVYDCNTSAWRSAKPGQWLSGQTSRASSLGQPISYRFKRDA